METHIALCVYHDETLGRVKFKQVKGENR